MPRVIPPGFAECSIEHWLAGYNRPAVVTMGIKITGDSDGSFTVADRFHQAFTGAFRTGVDTNVTMRNARAVIGQDGGDPIVQVSAMSIAGTSNRDSIAPALALMLTKNTSLGGRRNRGRMFFPWAVSDTGVAENGAVASATLDNWNGYCDDFIGFLEDNADYNPIDGAVLLHSDPAVPPTPITSMRPNPAIRTQRRRQVRF